MIHFFPDPYDDEIFFHLISRYHYYSGNNSRSMTLMELFNKSQITVTMSLGCNLEEFNKKISWNTRYSAEFFLRKHTLYPLIMPFLLFERQEEIKINFEKYNGNLLNKKMKVMNHTISKDLKYCPICSQLELKVYGEAYFHRVHQIFGVDVCPEHKCLLLTYWIKPEEKNKNQLIKIKDEKLSNTVLVETDEELQNQKLRIANCAQALLNCNVELHAKNIFDRYLTLLNNKGYLDNAGLVYRDKLFTDFTKYYSNSFLKSLKSELNKNRDNNDWLSRITRKPQWVIPPIQHILLINFLTSDFDQFLKTEPFSIKPFGDGPWYCLNPVCQNYKKRAVNQLKIKKKSTRGHIGYFTCSCGYSYRRISTGKDFELEGKVVQFGYVWEEKLKEYINEEKYPLTVIAKMMSCSYRTVLRYADKQDLLEKINTTISVKYTHKERIINEELRKKYSQDILDYIYNNPECSRTDIRKHLVKQCSWLNKYDNVLFEEILPPKIKKSKPKGQIINWEERDKEFYNELKEAYAEISTNREEIRKITKSSLATAIGKRDLIMSNLDKLPNANAFLSSIEEDELTYNLRKIDFLCAKFYQSKGCFNRSDILRKVGYKDRFMKDINKRIDENLINWKKD